MGLFPSLFGPPEGGSDSGGSTGGVSQRRSILDGLMGDAQSQGGDSLFDKVKGVADAVGLDSAASRVFEGLDTMSLLQRYTLSGLVELDDLIQDPDDASFDDLSQQVEDHMGVGDLLEGSDLPMWAKRLGGFVGDVATDPLSYVSLGTSAVAAHGAEAAAGAAARGVAREGAETGLTRLSRGLVQSDEVMSALLHENVYDDIVTELGSKEAAESALNEVARRGPAALYDNPQLSAAVNDTYRTGVAFGFGDARVLIPGTEGFANQVSLLGDAIKNKTIRRVLNSPSISEVVPGMRQLKAGENGYLKAFQFRRASRGARAFENTLLKTYNSQLHDIETRAAELDPDDIRRAIEHGDMSNPAAAEYAQWYAKVKTDYHTLTGEELGDIENYFPRQLEDQVRELVRGGSRYGQSRRHFKPETFEFERQYTKGSDFMGHKLEVGDIDEIHQILKIEFGDDYIQLFKTDPFVVARGYARSMAKKAGLARFETDLSRAGLFAKVDPEKWMLRMADGKGGVDAVVKSARDNLERYERVLDDPSVDTRLEQGLRSVDDETGELVDKAKPRKSNQPNDKLAALGEQAREARATARDLQAQIDGGLDLGNPQRERLLARAQEAEDTAVAARAKADLSEEQIVALEAEADRLQALVEQSGGKPVLEPDVADLEAERVALLEQQEAFNTAKADDAVPLDPARLEAVEAKLQEAVDVNASLVKARKAARAEASAYEKSLADQAASAEVRAKSATHIEKQAEAMAAVDALDVEIAALQADADVLVQAGAEFAERAQTLSREIAAAKEAAEVRLRAEALAGAQVADEVAPVTKLDEVAHARAVQKAEDALDFAERHGKPTEKLEQELDALYKAKRAETPEELALRQANKTTTRHNLEAKITEKDVLADPEVQRLSAQMEALTEVDAVAKLDRMHVQLDRLKVERARNVRRARDAARKIDTIQGDEVAPTVLPEPKHGPTDAQIKQAQANVREARKVVKQERDLFDSANAVRTVDDTAEIAEIEARLAEIKVETAKRVKRTKAAQKGRETKLENAVNRLADIDEAIETHRLTVAEEWDIEAKYLQKAERLFQKAAKVEDVNLAHTARLEALAWKAEAKLRRESIKVTQRAEKRLPEVYKSMETAERFAEAVDNGLHAYTKGRYADPDVAVVLTHMAEKAKPKNLHGFLKSYDALLSRWKAYALLSPGFHMRNAQGAVFNNWVDDVKWSTYLLFDKNYRAVKRGFKNNGGDFFRAIDEEIKDPRVKRAFFDMFGDDLLQGKSYNNIRDFADIDITGKLEPGIARRVGLPTGGTKTIEGGFDPTDLDNYLLHANHWMAGEVEHYVRGTQYLDNRLRGITHDGAMEKVRKFHFDYSELSQLESSTMRRLIPFYTWTRKNLPLQLEMMVRKPGRYTTFIHAKENIELGLDEQEVVPEYYASLLGIQTPFSVGPGGILPHPNEDVPEGEDRLWLTPDLPFRDIAEIADPNQLLSMVTPAISIPLQVIAGKQFFSGVPFDDRLEPAPSYGGLGNVLYPVLEAIDGRFGFPRVVSTPDGYAIREADRFVLDSASPLLGRIRRLQTDNGDSTSDPAFSTWLSTLAGVSTRTNDAGSQYGELSRRIEVINSILGEHKVRTEGFAA